VRIDEQTIMLAIATSADSSTRIGPANLVGKRPGAPLA
jgi:hypothetical protein